MDEQTLSNFLQANLTVLQRLDEKLHTLIRLTDRIDRSIGVDDNIPMEELKGREGFSLVPAEKDQQVQCIVGGQTIIGIAREKILQHEKIIVGGGDIANPDIYPIPIIIRGTAEGSNYYNISNVSPSGEMQTVVAGISSGSGNTRIMIVGLDKGSLSCSGWNVTVNGFDDSTLTAMNLPDTITNKTTGDVYSTAGATVSSNVIALSADENQANTAPTATDVLSLSLIFSVSDELKHFPPTIAEMSLAAGATYTTTYAANKKLLYLSVDLPQGVECTITNDITGTEVTWLEDTDSIGALEFVNGILFGNFKITVENTTAIAQTWSVKAIFEAYE